MTAPSGGDDVGTLAQEAIKLARVLAQQATDGRFAADGADPGARTTPPDHRPEVCDYCPLCQLLTVVQHARPEVAEHLVAALTSLTLAARGVVESWAAPRTGDAGTHADGPVENIDVEDGPWE